jgi:hypothetical protein
LSVLPPANPADDIGIRNRYNEEVRWEILLLEPVNDWFLGLCKDHPLTADKIEEALDELAVCGPQLGRPLVDRIHIGGTVDVVARVGDWTVKVA